MSYDSKSETEKEFGCGYEEIKSDPAPIQESEYQDAKYVLSTLNRQHAENTRNKRRSTNVRTVIAALAIGVTSVGAIAVTMISKSKSVDGQIAIDLPVSDSEMESIKLICDKMDYSSAIYCENEKYYLDTEPLFTNQYTLTIQDKTNKQYTDVTSIESGRGKLDAECALTNGTYQINFVSGDLTGYSKFETYVYDCNLESIGQSDGALLSSGDTLEDATGTIELSDGKTISIVTYGSYTIHNGDEVKLPLIGLEK